MEGARRVPELICAELIDAGRDAEREEIRVRPGYHLALALYAAIGAAGGVISAVASEALGLALLLFATAAMYLDVTGRLQIARYLLPRRPAQNVTSRGDRPDAAARVVLTANHDAARTGLLYWRRRPRRPARRRRWRPSTLVGAIDVCFWALAGALVAAAVRLITGSDSDLLSAIQFSLTVILMTYVVLFIDVAMSPASEGANANASGAATLLELGRRIARDPLDAIDVWLVFPAAQEGFMLGMGRWMKAHGEDLDPRRTFFVHVDCVGGGKVHHVTGEGMPLLYRHDTSLVRICERLGSEPKVWRTGTDGVIPAMQGFPSVTLVGADEAGRVPNHRRTSDTVENLDSEALDAAVDYVEELVRRIDDIAARRVAADTAPVERAPEA
jgi:Peptidase family M28